MRKIAFIGGGSAKFVRELVVDLFSYKELENSTISLMDINKERLDLSRRLVEKIIKDRKLKAKVEASTDQRRAIKDADFIVITVMVGGYECYKRDVEIPRKYGVLQTVSDTTGPGAVMRILRTAPVLKKLVADAAELCPDAWILNYSNPMAMNVEVLNKCGHARSVGLCHSIQGCAVEIVRWLGLDPAEVDYAAGGINHRNFYLKLERAGRDLYPDLLKIEKRIVKERPAERMRFELLRYLGAFPAEGPAHQAEYYPWIMKDATTAKYYGAEVGFGYEVDSKNFHNRSTEIREQIAGAKLIHYQRSNEYGVRIIHSLVTGSLRKFYGNVPNRGLISNLPSGAIVEVPCVVDRNGIIPCGVGAIPSQLAAVMTPHIWLSEMAVDAVLSKNRTLLRQAIQADPLSSAILTLPKIKAMTDELLAANKEYLKGW